MAAPFLLAACQQAEAPANNLAAPAPKADANGDVSTAERLVRARVGTAGAQIRFAGARRSASDGIPIVCGVYEQDGARQRYIVVNGEDAWIEPQMHPGQMDQAVAEFCGEGHDNRPPPVLGREGNSL